MTLFLICRHSRRYISSCIHRTSCMNSNVHNLHRKCIVPLSYQQIGLIKHARRSSTFEADEPRTSDVTGNGTTSLNNLINNERNNRPLTRDDIEELIEIYENSDKTLDIDASITLLKCCGKYLSSVAPEDRAKLAVRVLALISKKNCELTLEHYNTFLRISIENSQRIDHDKFLQYMIVEPDIVTYTYLLEAADRNGDSKSVINILNEMRDKFVLTEELNALAVKEYSKIGNMKNAFEIHNSMLNKPKENYFWLAYGCINMNDTMRFINMLTENGIVVDIEELIGIVNEWDGESEIPDITPLLRRISEEDNNEVATNVLQLINKLRIADTCDFIESVASQTENKFPMRLFVNTVLCELCRFTLQLDDVSKIVDKLAQFDNLQRLLSELARVALEKKETDVALFLFKKMRRKSIPVRPHYYWPLLATAKEKGEKEIYKLLNCMESIDVHADYNTIIDYVLPYVNMINPYLVVKKLMAYGVKNSLAYSCVISYLLTHEQLENVHKVFPTNRTPKLDFSMIVAPLVKEYKRTGLTYNCMQILQLRALEGYSPKREFLIKLLEYDTENGVDDFLKFVHLYKEEKETLSVHDVNTLIKVIDDLMLSEDLKHAVYELSDNIENVQKTYNTRQLEISVSTHELNNANIRGDLRRLLLNYCKEGNVREALKIRDKFNSYHFTWTAGMKASLAELFIKHDMANEATAILKEISSEFPSFTLDSYKLVELAKCLVKNGNYEAAISAIKSDKYLSFPKSISKNCVELLNTIAETHDFAKTKQMFILLVENKYIDLSNKTAGPLIRAHLIKNDLSAAVKTFEMCVKKFKVAPLSQELLVALVEQLEDVYESNGYGRVKRVVDLVAIVYGYPHANHKLLLASAKCKKINYMRELLQAVKTINSEQIIYHIAYFSPEDKMAILPTIIEESMNVDTIDKNLLSEYLLPIYDTKNDCEGIINLWKMLERIKVEPSLDFVTTSMNILNSNKITIPPEINIEKYKITDNVSTNN